MMKASSKWILLTLPFIPCMHSSQDNVIYYMGIPFGSKTIQLSDFLEMNQQQLLTKNNSHASLLQLPRYFTSVHESY